MAKKSTAKPQNKSTSAPFKTKAKEISAGGKTPKGKPASKKLKGTVKTEKAKVAKFKKSSPAQAQEIMQLLCKTYPDADCELNFQSTFQLLTSVILSAQTTDVGVNKVTPVLFKKFPDAKSMAEGNIEEIKEIIRPTGYFNSKATNIQRCAQSLVEQFGGEVPQTLEELTTLPGVGRKTANVVLGVAFGVPGWTVDTHVQRLAGRLGFTEETDPYKIELALQKLFANQDWSKYSITLIWHGRRICYARKPDCPKCPVNHLCPSVEL
jgi:endonuclease-3